MRRDRKVMVDVYSHAPLLLGLAHLSVAALAAVSSDLEDAIAGFSLAAAMFGTYIARTGDRKRSGELRIFGYAISTVGFAILYTRWLGVIGLVVPLTFLAASVYYELFARHSSRNAP